MSKVSKVWKRHNNGDYTWNGYEIRTIAVKRNWGAINTYWAYSPDGGCLIAAGDDLALAKKLCYQHFGAK